MFRKLTSLLLFIILSLNTGLITNADVTLKLPTGAGVKTPYLKVVSSKGAVSDSKYSVNALVDRNPQLPAAFSPLKGASVVVSLPDNLDLTRVRIGVVVAGMWRHIKKINLSVYDAESPYTNEGSMPRFIKTVDVNDSSGLNEKSLMWVDTTFEQNAVTHLVVEIADVYDNMEADFGGIGEVEVYSNYDGVVLPDISLDSMQADGTMKMKDMSIVQSTSGMGPNPPQQVIDDNEATIGGLNPIDKGFFVFQFTYPTDITRIRLRLNSFTGIDWAVAKDITVSVYNTEVKFNKKLIYPAPKAIAQYTCANNDSWQEIAITPEMATQATHLVVKINSVYTNTNAYGGFREISVFGKPDVNGQPVAEIVRQSIIPDAELLEKSGILQGEDENGVTEEYLKSKPTRVQGAIMFLRMLGLYEEAKNFQENDNFADIGELEWAKPITAYLKAHPELGMVGVGNNEFEPNGLLTARAYYKMILTVLGYEYEKDFTWENMPDLLRKLGIGKAVYIKDFTIHDLAIATFDGLTTVVKDKTTLLADSLADKGVITKENLDLIKNKSAAFDFLDYGTFKSTAKQELTNNDFSFKLEGAPRTVMPEHFFYNMAFQYPGIFYGTLPKDDPRSDREEFAKALKTIGCVASRFPGGLDCHQYFIEGEEYTKKLFRDNVKFQPNITSTYLGGLYNADNSWDSYYVDTFNWLDFCKEYDFLPMFQINTSFYVDPNDKKIYSITKNRFSVNAKGEIMPEYYDHDRIEEAAAALGKHIDEMLKRGYKIKYWELGNEDFNTANYMRIPITDPSNPTAQNYAKIASAFAKVIKQKIPDAVLIWTDEFPNIFAELEKLGTLDLAGLMSTHYPFGQNNDPPAAENKNLARLVETNDIGFKIRGDKITEGYANKGYPNWPWVISETTNYRLEAWRAIFLNNTFANALNTIHNWGQLTFETPSMLNCVHSLEETFFGAVQYGVYLDPADRWTHWTDGNKRVWKGPISNPKDIPAENRFIDKYYINPYGYAMGMFSKHIGGQVMITDPGSLNRKVSAFASLKDSEIRITVVNRLNATVPVSFSFDGYDIPEQEASMDIMQSSWLGAATEGEYKYLKDQKMLILGSRAGAGKAVSFEAEPYSIFQLVFNTK